MVLANSGEINVVIGGSGAGFVIEVDGEQWQVAVSGRTTQYTRDEFGLVFTRGTPPRTEGCRTAGRGLMAVTHDLERKLREVSDVPQPVSGSRDAPPPGDGNGPTAGEGTGPARRKPDRAGRLPRRMAGRAGVTRC